jgi:acetate---CoA ligase (ADP-forming)
LEYLAASGVPIVPSRLVRGADAAVEVAAELGYPVVAKFGDADVTHKTELGGVITGLEDEAAVRGAVARLEAAGSREVLIQRQLAGVELIFGVTSDPALGSFLIVGLGGIWTEVLQDVVIVPVGLAAGEAERVLARLRGHGLLEGARGTAPVDKAALVQALECLDALAGRLGDQIASIDVNPIIATPAGAWAVDALIVPASPP